MLEPRVATQDLPDIEADGVAIGLFEGQSPDAVVPPAVAPSVARLVALGDFEGKSKQTAVLYPEGLRAARLVLVGLGKADEFTLDGARQAAGKAALRARELGAKRIAIVPPGAPGKLDWATAAGAAAEGALLGLYRHDEFRTEKREELKTATDLILAVPPEAEASALRAVAQARALAEAVNWIRTLVNRPGNALDAAAFAAEAAAMASTRPVRCKILELDEMVRLGMGCIVGVNAGSAAPAKLIVLEYDGVPDGEPIALVGKGITFDTGGISLKPRVGMEEMKDDMAGGAAVLGTVRAAADLALPVRLVGIVPATDNMPGSRALKPGDVLRSYQGLTIEIADTDAEGRLVLADGLAYAARQYAPRALIDLATLTGSVYVALGRAGTGLFTKDDRMAGILAEAAEATGERVWRLPLWPEHADLVSSDIADLRNQGEKGDSDGIAAAVFLSRFTVGLPWAHLDIAGTSWAEKKQPYIPKGATGVGVRLLVEALRRGL